MIPPPPISTLFPYTTLFRSGRRRPPRPARPDPRRPARASGPARWRRRRRPRASGDRKSTRLNSSHVSISYAVFCLKKKIHESDDDCYVDFYVQEYVAEYMLL